MGFPSPLLLGQIPRSPDYRALFQPQLSLAPNFCYFSFSPPPRLLPIPLSVSNSESVPLPLSFANSRSLSLSSSVSASWYFPGSHICFSLRASLYLYVWITLPSLSLFLSLFLSIPTPPPNSAASTSPIFNCLNCLFCGWAVIKRYLGYSPLGLRSGLPGSPDHKGHSWVE